MAVPVSFKGKKGKNKCSHLPLWSMKELLNIFECHWAVEDYFYDFPLYGYMYQICEKNVPKNDIPIMICT